MNPVAFMPKPAPAPAVPKNQPSGWERWLPTIGSTVGSIGGDLLGGAADVATGGLATPLINPITMSTLLSGLGGAAGQATENGLSGQNPFQMNDLTQGGIGAGANLAGFGVGKLLGMGGKAIGQVGSDMAAQTASEKAAQGALDAAQSTKNAFGGINDGVQIANNLKDNQGLMTQFGRNPASPEEMAHVAQGGDLINQVDNEALSTGKPIETNKLLSSNNIVNLSPQEQQALMDSGIVQNGAFTQLPDTITPQQANDFAQSLGAQEREARALMENARTASPKDFTPLKQEYNQISQLYKQAKEVAGTPEVNASIAARTVTPEEKAALVQEYGQKQADYVEEQINNAKTHADLVAAKRPFAEMGNISRSAIRDEQAVATPRGLARAKESAGELPAKAGGKNIKSLRNIAALFGVGQEVSGGKKSTLMNALDLAAIAQDAPEIFGNGDTVSKLGNLLTRAGKYANVPATAVGNMATAQTPNATGDPMIQNALQQIQQTPNPYSNPLANAEQLLSEQAINPTMISGGSPASSVTSLMQAAQKYSEAQAAIESMLRLYGQAGGAQGPAGGALSYISSLFGGGEASRLGQLKNSQNGLASILNNAGIGGAQSVMPSIFMNGPTANANIGSLSNILGALSPQVGNAG
jgi:hypothetical protein